jgi:transcriptional regulator GlxA family with amidase domain
VNTRALVVFASLAALGGGLALVLADATPAAATRKGPIRVAFVVTEGANVMDFAGPWEAFQDVDAPGGGFELFTVSDSKQPVRMTGGVRVVPDYAFADAPKPDVVVVGAQRGSDATTAWLRKAAGEADVVMSVCTGAFKLAKAGLLDGKRATTHHDFFDNLARDYPKVEVVRGRRWVESSPKIYTAGGLTSGIDLALHVVAKYYGVEVADRTALYMEHDGGGWKDATATPIASRTR